MSDPGLCVGVGSQVFYPRPASFALVSPPRPGSGPGGGSHKEWNNVPEECLGHGSSNTVFRTPVTFGGTPTVLRVTSSAKRDEEELDERRARVEAALMRILARPTEGIHPFIWAQGVMNAPVTCPGIIAATLMTQALPLVGFLSGETDRVAAWALAQSLYVKLCRAADLGLCLCDVRPSNVLYDSKRTNCFLIDLGVDYVAWMDQRLVAMFDSSKNRRGESYWEDDGMDDSYVYPWQELAGRRRDVRQFGGGSFDDMLFGRRGLDGRTATIGTNARQNIGSACAKTRGVQLFFMVLLMRSHLVSMNTANGYAMARFFEMKLKLSCVPLDKLHDLTENSGLKGDLMTMLMGRHWRYFRNRTAYPSNTSKSEYGWQAFREFLLGSHRLLQTHDCDGKTVTDVTIGGVSYQQDFASCAGNAFAGRGLRSSAIMSFEDREYPCPFDGYTPAVRYTIDSEGSAFQLRGRPPLFGLPGRLPPTIRPGSRPSPSGSSESKLPLAPPNGIKIRWAWNRSSCSENKLKEKIKEAERAQRPWA